MSFQFFISLFFFFLMATQVQSKIEILPTDITGVSHAEFITDLEGFEKLIVYGGQAGPCEDDPSQYETCNTCKAITDSGAIQACNLKSVRDDLMIVFSFKSDKSASKVFLMNGNHLIKEQETNDSSVYQIEITWEEVCKGLQKYAEGSCENFSHNLSLAIGNNTPKDLSETTDHLNFNLIHASLFNIDFEDEIDCESDSGAICKLDLIPGDKKASISRIILAKTEQTSSAYPNSSTQAQFSHLRLMYGPSFDQALPSNPRQNTSNQSNTGFLDLQIHLDGNSIRLLPNQISQLNNHEEYYFRIASVDKAQNVYLFSSNSDMMVQPHPVTGIMTEDQNCFITTATYGSSSYHIVSIFRHFRNNVLLNYTLGQRFQIWYYEKGSYYSHYLNEYPLLKIPVRLILEALSIILLMTLSFPFSLMIFICIFCSFYFIKKRRCFV